MDRTRAVQSQHQPLGTEGDYRRRLLLHHAPLAVASALVIAMLMGFPVFDPRAHPHPDITSGTFPQHRQGEGAVDRAEHQRPRLDHGWNTNGRLGHVSGSHSGGHGQPGASRSHEAPMMDPNPEAQGANLEPRDTQAESSLPRNLQRLTRG